MADAFDPVRTWVRYGIGDLYFAYANQSNDVYRYGTFFFIMAAEKHLKGVLIAEKRQVFEALDTLDGKRSEVEAIVRGYSHNFDRMIQAVSLVYRREFKQTLLESDYFGYPLDVLVKAMYEGYMETRYPTANNTFRHFPILNSEGAYHDPLGSSFFSDFMQYICRKCWRILIKQGLDGQAVLEATEDQFKDSRDYDVFESVYLQTLPVEL